MVAGTGLLGSALVLMAVDYFVDLFRACLYAVRAHDGQGVALGGGGEGMWGAGGEGMCWWSWVLYGVWPVLFAVSVVVQWRLTANDLDHSSATATGNGTFLFN